jgi:hypothetical protein
MKWATKWAIFVLNQRALALCIPVKRQNGDHSPDWAYCFKHGINYKPCRWNWKPVAGLSSCPRCIDERNTALKAARIPKKKNGR